MALPAHVLEYIRPRPESAPDWMARAGIGGFQRPGNEECAALPASSSCPVSVPASLRSVQLINKLLQPVRPQEQRRHYQPRHDWHLRQQNVEDDADNENEPDVLVRNGNISRSTLEENANYRPVPLLLARSPGDRCPSQYRPGEAPRAPKQPPGPIGNHPDRPC